MRPFMIRLCLWSHTWQPFSRDPRKDKWRPEAELSRLKVTPAISHGLNPRYEAEYAQWFEGNLDQVMESVKSGEKEGLPAPASPGPSRPSGGSPEIPPSLQPPQQESLPPFHRSHLPPAA